MVTHPVGMTKSSRWSKRSEDHRKVDQFYWSRARQEAVFSRADTRFLPGAAPKTHNTTSLTLRVSVVALDHGASGNSAGVTVRVWRGNAAADGAGRGSLSERVLPSVVSGATRDNQRANSMADNEATLGVGPDDSVRGSGVSVADVSNSTSIVVEVNRIAGLPGIGPATLSAAAAAMSGNGESRRAIV